MEPHTYSRMNIDSIFGSSSRLITLKWTNRQNILIIIQTQTVGRIRRLRSCPVSNRSMNTSPIWLTTHPWQICLYLLWTIDGNDFWGAQTSPGAWQWVGLHEFFKFVSFFSITKLSLKVPSINICLWKYKNKTELFRFSI